MWIVAYLLGSYLYSKHEKEDTQQIVADSTFKVALVRIKFVEAEILIAVAKACSRIIVQ